MSQGVERGQGRGKSGLSEEQEAQLQSAVAELEADGGLPVRLCARVSDNCRTRTGSVTKRVVCKLVRVHTSWQRQTCRSLEAPRIPSTGMSCTLTSGAPLILSIGLSCTLTHFCASPARRQRAPRCWRAAGACCTRRVRARRRPSSARSWARMHSQSTRRGALSMQSPSHCQLY